MRLEDIPDPVNDLADAENRIWAYSNLLRRSARRSIHLRRNLELFAKSYAERYQELVQAETRVAQLEERLARYE
jgi:hypothetical protein